MNTKQKIYFWLATCAFAITPTATHATKANDFGKGFLDGTNLPKGDAQTLAKGILNSVTGILGTVLVAMIVYGGTLYLTSAGNDDRVQTGKRVLTYAIIGIVIVAAANIIARFTIDAITGSTT